MAELNDPAPKYWVHRREMPATGTRGAGAMFTGGVEVYYDAMVGDQVVGTYRASYYGGERYARSEAEHQIEKARIQAANEERAKRQAKAARYAAKSGGGQGMSSTTEELKTRYNTAVDNVVAAIVNINAARDDLETAQQNVEAELKDSNDPDARSALEAMCDADEGIKELNSRLAALQQFLENVRDGL